MGQVPKESLVKMTRTRPFPACQTVVKLMEFWQMVSALIIRKEDTDCPSFIQIIVARAAAVA